MVKITYKAWVYNPDKRDFDAKEISKVFETINDFLHFIMNQDYESIDLTVYKDNIYYKIKPCSNSLCEIAIKNCNLFLDDVELPPFEAAYLDIFPSPKDEGASHWSIKKIWLDDVLIADLTGGQDDYYMADEFIDKVIIPLYGYFPFDLINDEVGLLNQNLDYWLKMNDFGEVQKACK